METLKPSAQVLCGLASIAVHAEELLSPTAHHFDRDALKQAFATPGVRKWIEQMTTLGMAPVKR